jgi:heme/copper-type cytochrome/quinol oxidase subunit 2
MNNKSSLFCSLVIGISLSGCSLLARTSLNLPDASNKVDYNEQNATITAPIVTNNAHKSFNLVAYNFFYSENKLIVNKGDVVTIYLTSQDGLHDFTMDGIPIQSTVFGPNEKTVVSFIADKAGEFQYFSSLGEQKQLGLAGRLIVLP